MVNAAHIKTIGGPVFASIPDPTIETWIELGTRHVSAKAFGKNYSDALTFWTLHHLTVNVLQSNSGAGMTGPASSIRVGNVAVSFATPTNQGGSGESSTAWGQMYLRLRNALGGVAIAG